LPAIQYSLNIAYIKAIKKLPLKLILNIKPKSATNFLFGKNVTNLVIIYILYKFKAKIIIAYAIIKAKIKYNAIKNLIAIGIGN